jgi:hypothetical protein
LGVVKIRDRDVMFAFAGCVALALLWDPFVTDSIATGSIYQILNLSLKAGEALAIFALFSVITRMGNDTLLLRVDLWISAGFGVAFALPSASCASVAMSAMALMFVARRDARLTAIAQLLLALVTNRYLGRTLFDLLAPYALRLETAAVAMILSPFGNFSRDGVSLIGPNGHSIFIDTGCSAFHNITAAALIWLALIKIERLQLLRSDWWALVAMVGATILVNTIRIALMAQSRVRIGCPRRGGAVRLLDAVGKQAR